MRKLYFLLVLCFAFAFKANASHQLPLLNPVWTVNPDGTIGVSANSDPSTNGGATWYYMLVEFVCYSGSGPINWALADTMHSLNSCYGIGCQPYILPQLNLCPGSSYAMRARERLSYIAFGSATDISSTFWTPTFFYTMPGTPPPFAITTTFATLDTVCAGTSSQLGTTVTGGCNIGGSVKYEWNPKIGVDSPYIANPTVLPTVTTTYIIIATDECSGSTDVDSVTVVVPPTPTLGAVAGPNGSTQSQVICQGDTAFLQLLGSGGVSFQWYSSTNGTTFTPVSGATSSTYTTPPMNSTTQYYVAVVGPPNTCPGITSKLTVTVVPSPQLSISPFSPEMCIGDTMALHVTGGETYTWFPVLGIDTPTSANPLVFPTTTSWYYVDSENSYGCKGRDSVEVIVNQKPVPTASATSSICPLNNGTATIDGVNGGTPAYSYSINGGSFGTNPEFTNLGPGTYVMAVRDVKGCSNAVNVTVNEIIDVIANFTANPDQGFIPLEVSFSNLSDGTITSYNWDFGDGSSSDEFSPGHTFGEHGTYNVVLTAYGSEPRCFDTAMVVIEAIGQSSLEEPNVFTPNGDGMNDNFSLNTRNLTELELLIFDRWGRKVATITDPNAVWDGTRNGGGECSAGTYFYNYTAKGIDNYSHRGSGTVELIR